MGERGIFAAWREPRATPLCVDILPSSFSPPLVSVVHCAPASLARGAPSPGRGRLVSIPFP
eukprot:5098721-Pyramimonas_sp.AAC.1